jgi:hypothetical protein
MWIYFSTIIWASYLCSFSDEQKGSKTKKTEGKGREWEGTVLRKVREK